MVGGDRLGGALNDVLHIKLDRLARKHVAVLAADAAHSVDKRNTLRLSGEHNVVLGCELAKLLSTALGKLNVTEKDKCANIQLARNGAKGEISCESCNVNGIFHSIAFR